MVRDATSRSTSVNTCHIGMFNNVVRVPFEQKEQCAINVWKDDKRIKIWYK